MNEGVWALFESKTSSFKLNRQSKLKAISSVAHEDKTLRNFFMNIFDYMTKNGHEKLVFCSNKKTGLRAIMAIHDTRLGPAMGPPKMSSFPSEEDAITEALRFAHDHTYKNAMANVPFAGGRIIVLGDPSKDKGEDLIRALGRFVESMGGHYILTGGGAGFSNDDTKILLRETRHIIGLPSELGGGGDPALMTGYGICQGLKACADEVYGADSLKGKIVAISGLGKVGAALASHLIKRGAHLIIADPRPEAVELGWKNFGAEIVEPQKIFDVECDILSPCSISNYLNSRMIQRLKCKIVGGSANNMLEDADRNSEELQQRGILYAPEFIINAGAVINFYSEIGGYDPERARLRTKKIKKTLKAVFARAKSEGVTPLKAAYSLAKEKIQQAPKKS